MKIFFIGSSAEDSSENFNSYCKALGYHIAQSNIDIIVCSPFKDAADYYVIDGIKSSKIINVNIELHYPKDENIENEWDKIITKELIEKEIRINRFRHFPIELESKRDWKYSWFFCQLQALKKSDIVFIIGGDVNGSSNLLLRIAETQSKDIFPIHQFGGCGYLFFERNKYELRDKLGYKYFPVLESHDKMESLISLILEFPFQNNCNLSFQDPVFFISYPRARPAEADFIEMILRRRNYTVLRDEDVFDTDEDIPNSIKENIYRSNVFISIWCKEYACSPWCFDELTLALERKNKNNLNIWLICVDETRIIHPEARTMLHHLVHSRQEIEGKILNLLEKL